MTTSRLVVVTLANSTQGSVSADLAHNKWILTTKSLTLGAVLIDCREKKYDKEVQHMLWNSIVLMYVSCHKTDSLKQRLKIVG